MKFWQVDAFTKEPFKGNPAAVFVLKEELSDELMQNIAIEMNLSETAYILLREGRNPLLRWFTSVFEIDLCGHATLASAHIYLTEVFPDLKSVTFDTKWVGELTVTKNNGAYTMDFPVRAGEPVDVSDIPDCVIKGLGGKTPVAAYKARDLMMVYEQDKDVISINPDFNALKDYDDPIIVTAPDNTLQHDFISRFFIAGDAMPEDPVTGSAHCTLAPYWSERLGKAEMLAYQASKRGGELKLEIKGDRLLITGDAVTVFEGEMR